MSKWKKRVAALLLIGNLALLFIAGAGLVPGWGERCGGVCLDRPAPELSLLTYGDRPLSLEAGRGKFILLFFGYASCPSVCPTALAAMAKAMGEARGVPVEGWFVSIDPERDGGERIKAYLAGFDGPFSGLYGPEAAVKKVAASYNEFYARDWSRDGYEIDHAGRVYLIDPAGRLRVVYPGADPEGMAADLIRLGKGGDGV